MILPGLLSQSMRLVRLALCMHRFAEQYMLTSRIVSAGSLAALQLYLKNAKSVPDVTIVLFFTANCIYTLSDLALLMNYDLATKDVPMTAPWKDWLGKDVDRRARATPPLNVTIAPALHYQTASWTPTSLECRGLTFPQYDWVWEQQVTYRPPTQHDFGSTFSSELSFHDDVGLH
jgi:hypothetical protein